MLCAKILIHVFILTQIACTIIEGSKEVYVGGYCIDLRLS